MESVSTLWTTNPDSLRALWGTLINQRDRAVLARAPLRREHRGHAQDFHAPALSCSPLSL